jgi:hypothetical protein
MSFCLRRCFRPGFDFQDEAGAFLRDGGPDIYSGHSNAVQEPWVLLASSRIFQVWPVNTRTWPQALVSMPQLPSISIFFLAAA